MTNTEILHKVKTHFSLNIYETKVWLALLQKGVASAGEIAEMSGVPRSRTYDVLESLEKQGFAIQKIGKPVKYLAVKPTQVIDKLKKNAVEILDNKIKTLSNIKETSEYEELETLHNSTRELIKNQDISGTIKGRLNINSQISDTLNLAKKEVLICTSTYELKKRQKLLEPIFKNLNKTGINLTVALKGSDEEIEVLSNKFKIKTKKVDLDSSFYIADRNEIVFMLNKIEESNDPLAVWFASPFFVQAFTGLFDLALKRGGK
ncbi:MAG: helix-turn-helix domain-containing protein [Nanoarchaeota archaeon]|nr:helix-turn-helix domain-containing protein [Nanoarchaeota archaeon]